MEYAVNARPSANNRPIPPCPWFMAQMEISVPELVYYGKEIDTFFLDRDSTKSGTYLKIGDILQGRFESAERDNKRRQTWLNQKTRA